MRGLLIIEPLYHQTIAGNKTQTRRSGGLELLNGRKATKKHKAIIANPDHWFIANTYTNGRVEFIKKLRYQKQPDIAFPMHPDDTVICTPRYKVGEILYLKEPTMNAFGVIKYRYSEYEAFDFFRKPDFPLQTIKKKWKNKLFMPASEAREYVRITGIRCERLFDISDKDCIAEGIEYIGEWERGTLWKAYGSSDEFLTFPQPKESFLSLYKFANKMKASAEIPNIWVWVYEYEYLKDYKA